MHIHPFGIPLDELIVVFLNAAHTPFSVYVGVFKGWLGRMLRLEA